VKWNVSPPAIVAAAVAASSVWTCLTGQIWHWVPVAAAAAAGLLIVRAVGGGEGADPPKAPKAPKAAPKAKSKEKK
jgi:hypothetical protein